MKYWQRQKGKNGWRYIGYYVHIWRQPQRQRQQCLEHPKIIWQKGSCHFSFVHAKVSKEFYIFHLLFSIFFFECHMHSLYNRKYTRFYTCISCVSGVDIDRSPSFSCLGHCSRNNRSSIMYAMYVYLLVFFPSKYSLWHRLQWARAVSGPSTKIHRHKKKK